MTEERVKRKLNDADDVVYSRLMEDSEASENILEALREDILDTLLIAITFLAIPALVASLYRSITIGWQYVMYLQIVVYLLLFITTLFRRKVPFLYKALILISLCFLIGGTAIINLGLISSGNILMLFSIILATMFLGVRYGGVFIFASLVVLITVALGVNQGWIEFDFDIEDAALNPSIWITTTIGFAFFTAILIFSLGRLINYLVDSSNILGERTLELKRTNERFLEEIEEKKRGEAILRESEERYRLLVENIPSVTWITNEHSKTTFISPNVERILGFRQEEIYEDGEALWFGRIHPDEREFVWRALKLIFETGQRFDFEYRLQRKDGEWIWIHDTAVEAFEKDNVRCAYGVFTEITDRKRAEEEKIILENQLRQVQKMEAIGTLAGGIAHDFNNILSSVFGYTELAKIKLGQGENIERYLNEVLNAGFRARDLVKQILTFSSQTEVEKNPIAIQSLLKESLKFLKASLPSSIEIRSDLGVADSTILADPTQMHQILINLCTNAAHAMKEKGGVLELRLEETEIEDERSVHKELKQGRYLRLTVSDTGHGMLEEVMDKIFDPFFTTKERGEGTGMGLSVVHGIIENMKGAVSVSSVPDKGTTFEVLLPIYEGEAPDLDSTKDSLIKGKGTILFVDDEEGILASTGEILNRLGYEVVTTTNPLKALEIFESGPDNYDLVLTDMTMPQMTGIELSENLIEIRSDIPIILCTGFAAAVTPEQCRDAGITDIVMKPMIASKLANAIDRVINPKTNRISHGKNTDRG